MKQKYNIPLLPLPYDFCMEGKKLRVLNLSVNSDMYPKMANWVHVNLDMYPKTANRVHVNLDMYPKTANWVHVISPT